LSISDKVKDADKLLMIFVLPSQLKHWKMDPLYFLRQILGNEGKGSILAHLKRKSLATGLT